MAPQGGARLVVAPRAVGDNRGMAGSRAGNTHTVTINRAPVLTLWAAVVAERLGYDRDEAVTLGQAVAGMNAAAKARAIGKFHPPQKAAAAPTRPRKVGEALEVLLCNRRVPAVHTPQGLRALNKGTPASPESVNRYLEGKFGDALADAREAMAALARSVAKDELEAAAFAFYEAFRPSIPPGTRGWGAKGVLDLDQIRALAAKRHTRS
jgi:hypothetical protein